MDTLGPESARVRDYLRSSFVDAFLEGEILKDRNWAFMPYMLLVLEHWLRAAPEAAKGDPSSPSKIGYVGELA